MPENSKSVTSTLEGLADVPAYIQGNVERLAETAPGRKIRRLDASAGRIVSRIKALVWLVAASIAGALAYTASAATSGWLEIILTGIPSIFALWALWCGVDNLRNPNTASAILIEEIEDRVVPARWALRILRNIFGRGGTAAEN